MHALRLIKFKYFFLDFKFCCKRKTVNKNAQTHNRKFTFLMSCISKDGEKENKKETFVSQKIFLTFV